MKVVVVHISSCTPSSKEMCGNIQPLYSKQSSYHSIHRKDTDEDERHITLCSYSASPRSVQRKTLRDVWSKKEAPEAGKYTVTSHTPSTINCKLARFELCGSVWHIHHQSLCSTAHKPEEVSRWLVVGTVSRMPLYIANIYESLSLAVYL